MAAAGGAKTARVPSVVNPSVMKWVSLVMLVAQTVGVVFTMRLSRIRSVTGPRYLNTTAVFLSEVVKLICSFAFLWNEQGSLARASELVWLHFTTNPAGTLSVSLPSLLYTVQNNLLFISLSNLNGAVYQVTYQLKILITAVLSVLLLGKSLGPVKWVALVTLTFGVTLIQFPRAGTEGSSAVSTPAGGSTITGFAAVLSACVTSGFAGVYLEKILKQTSASIWLRNIQLGFFGALLAFVGAVLQDGEKIRADGFLQGYSWLVWTVILLQAVGGLVVAAVLKYADNIQKCFGNALAIVISCLLSTVFLQEFVPDLSFVLGTLLVLLATTLYSIGLPEPVRRSLGLRTA